jgi:hypothetical protein
MNSLVYSALCLCGLCPVASCGMAGRGCELGLKEETLAHSPGLTG